MIELGLSNELIAQWDQLWAYFDRQWMPILDSWNMCEEDGTMKDVVNRTNNGLERYNLRYNGIFPSKPNLVTYVTKLEEESRWQYGRLESIRQGKEAPPVYSEKTIPEIPNDYILFKRRLSKKSRKTKM